MRQIKANVKNKVLIKSIVNPTPNLLIETKIKPEDKNIITSKKIMCYLQLCEIAQILQMKIKKLYFNLHLKKIFPLSQLNIFILMTILLLTKPETKIVGKPNFDGDNITMTPNNDKAEIKNLC